MPQIVERQALDTGGLADPLEGLGDRVGAHGPYPTIEAPWQTVYRIARSRISNRSSLRLIAKFL